MARLKNGEGQCEGVHYSNGNDTCNSVTMNVRLMAQQK